MKPSYLVESIELGKGFGAYISERQGSGFYGTVYADNDVMVGTTHLYNTVHEAITAAHNLFRSATKGLVKKDGLWVLATG